MRILCLYRYYWPDNAPFGRILQSIASEWIAHKHKVTVVSSQPGYNVVIDEPRPRKEIHDGVEIFRTIGFSEKKKRSAVRFVNHVLFALQCIVFSLFKCRYDVLVINSYPPILSGFVAWFCFKLNRKPYIYYVNDIHPESAKFAGQIKNNGFYRLLRWVDKNSCNNANILIAMSEDMANTIVERGVDREKIEILNVAPDAPAKAAQPPAALERDDEDHFNILFAGNMGKFQGLDVLIDAAFLLRHNHHIKFVFLGDGAMKGKLVEQAGAMVGRTVDFLPFAPPEVAYAAMQAADFGVVSLNNRIYQVAYPSKTLTYLSAGCPVAVLVEESSALANTIASNKLGIVCGQDDPQRIADEIEKAWHDRHKWRTERDRIQHYTQQHFSLQRFQKIWSELVEKTQAEN